jgi:hypothetical protein
MYVLYFIIKFKENTEGEKEADQESGAGEVDGGMLHPHCASRACRPLQVQQAPESLRGNTVRGVFFE